MKKLSKKKFKALVKVIAPDFSVHGTAGETRPVCKKCLRYRETLQYIVDHEWTTAKCSYQSDGEHWRNWIAEFVDVAQEALK